MWESFWAACADLGVGLVNHAANSGAGFFEISNPVLGGALTVLEAHPVARRIVPRMILGGVFERHPTLKVVLTEQPGTWYPSLGREMDHAFRVFRHNIEPQAPRLPSEYLRSNVFVGASFIAPYERDMYLQEGLVGNVMWGSDYPHVEGAWRPPLDDDEIPMTQLSMRHSSAGCAPDVVRRMVGLNAIEVFDLDAAALDVVAHRIGAPTVDEIITPLDAIPAEGARFAFR
jgi:predicted TIM-barrel fold metal-dependent hydrolase